MKFIKHLDLLISLFNGDIVTFVDRGNVSRSAVAYELCEREITKRGLESKYWCVAGRTQGIDPEDSRIVDYPNLTYYPQYELAREWLTKNEIDLSRHISDEFRPWFAERSSIIFAMDKPTLAAIKRIYPYYINKVHLFSSIRGEKHDIKDTEHMTDPHDVVGIYEEIKATLTNHFDNIATLIESQRKRDLESMGMFQSKERR